MKIKDTKTVTRQELSERTEGFAEKMEGLHEKLNETADDIETLRKLIEQIDPGGGTAEGIDQVEQYVEQADDAAVRDFDGHDQELENVHGENEEYGREVEDRGQVSESNLGRISDVTAPLKTQDAVGEIRAAKEAMVKDVEVLREVQNRIKDNAERSARLVEGLRQVRGSRG